MLSTNPLQRRNNKRSRRSKQSAEIHKRKNKMIADKRMRKEYNIGDKMFMNSSSKESFKHEEKTTTVIYLHHMVSSRSNDEVTS